MVLIYSIFLVPILYDNTNFVTKKPVLIYAKTKDAISHFSHRLCYSTPEKYETIRFVSCFIYIPRLFS